MTDFLMSFIYLGLLIVFIGCMVLCDHQWKLAFFRDARRAALAIGVTFAGFLMWDVFGIVTGTFYRGDSPYMTGLDLAPHMPVEELFFLFFLCYLTLNLTSAVSLVLKTPLPEQRTGKGGQGVAAGSTTVTGDEGARP